MGTLKTWLMFGALLTVVLGSVYAVGRHILRQSANDPQIQQAQDWADQMSSGAAPTSLSMGPYVDPAHSLAHFGIVYDKDGNIASSSVTAPTTMLQPEGVLAAVAASANKETSFTWQPTSGVRFATVIKQTTFAEKTYYVLAARNLRETEKRIDQTAVIIFWSWVTGLALIGAILHGNAVASRTLGRFKRRA